MENILVAIAAALGDSTRARIYVGLGDRPSVGEVAARAGVGISTASHHIHRLADAGLVRVVRRGRRHLVVRDERTWMAIRTAFVLEVRA